MRRLTLIAVIFVLMPATLCADEPSISAHKFAETQLLAEYVGTPDHEDALARAYYEGNGVPRDYKQAAKWFLNAANQGLARSQYQLAIMYGRGEGVNKDHTKAVEWFLKAAKQGYVPAQFELGNKYASGKGIPQNYADAYVWYSLAAASGHEKALKQRDSYARKLTHEEIMAAQRRSASLFAAMQQAKAME
jgi:TPR repeat protein